MKRLLSIAGGGILLVMIFLSASSLLNIVADDEVFQQRMEQLLAESRQGLSIPYLTIYLTTEADTLINQDQLHQTVNAITVESWDEVIALDRLNPIDVLIIHHSADKLVDEAWLNDAYQNRSVVIVGVNTPSEMISRWTGRVCAGGTDLGGDWFTIQSLNITADIEAEREMMLQGILNNCTHESYRPPVAIQGQLSGSLKGQILPIDDASYALLLRSILPLPING